MKDFRELRVWQNAHALTLDVYALTKSFPTEERYGITSQIRRAAASIPTNLAEGCGRSGDAEHARFAQIAMGSASEVEYLLMLCRDLDLINAAIFDSHHEKVVLVKRMLAKYIRYLRPTN